MSGRISGNELERALKFVWPCVETEIEIWIERLRSMLEDCDGDMELKEIHQAQGSLRALRSVLALPGELVAHTRIEEEREDKDGTATGPV